MLVRTDWRQRERGTTKELATATARAAVKGEEMRWAAIRVVVAQRWARRRERKKGGDRETERWSVWRATQRAAGSQLMALAIDRRMHIRSQDMGGSNRSE